MVEKASRPVGLELLELATVKIDAQGSFVDPQFGTMQNAAGGGSVAAGLRRALWRSGPLRLPGRALPTARAPRS